MDKIYEEWLVEVAKTENFSMLEKLPAYTETHCSKTRNPDAERRRLADYVSDYAPHTAFTRMLIAAIGGTIASGFT